MNNYLFSNGLSRSYPTDLIMADCRQKTSIKNISLRGISVELIVVHLKRERNLNNPMGDAQNTLLHAIMLQNKFYTLQKHQVLSVLETIIYLLENNGDPTLINAHDNNPFHLFGLALANWEIPDNPRYLNALEKIFHLFIKKFNEKRSVTINTPGYAGRTFLHYISQGTIDIKLLTILNQFPFDANILNDYHHSAGYIFLNFHLKAGIHLPNNMLREVINFFIKKGYLIKRNCIKDDINNFSVDENFYQLPDEGKVLSFIYQFDSKFALSLIESYITQYPLIVNTRQMSPTFLWAAQNDHVKLVKKMIMANWECARDYGRYDSIGQKTKKYLVKHSVLDLACLKKRNYHFYDVRILDEEIEIDIIDDKDQITSIDLNIAHRLFLQSQFVLENKLFPYGVNKVFIVEIERYASILAKAILHFAKNYKNNAVIAHIHFIKNKLLPLFPNEITIKTKYLYPTYKKISQYQEKAPDLNLLLPFQFKRRDNFCESEPLLFARKSKKSYGTHIIHSPAKQPTCCSWFNIK